MRAHRKRQKETRGRPTVGSKGMDPGHPFSRECENHIAVLEFGCHRGDLIWRIISHPKTKECHPGDPEKAENAKMRRGWGEVVRWNVYRGGIFGQIAPRSFPPQHKTPQPPSQAYTMTKLERRLGVSRR